MKIGGGFPGPLHIAIRQIIEHNRKLGYFRSPKANSYQLNEQREIFTDNEEIGDAFNLTYSSVSKSISGIGQLIIKDKKVKAAFEGLYSQFKM